MKLSNVDGFVPCFESLRPETANQERLSEQQTMTAPGDSLSAHQCDLFLLGKPDERLQACLKIRCLPLLLGFVGRLNLSPFDVVKKSHESFTSINSRFFTASAMERLEEAVIVELLGLSNFKHGEYVAGAPTRIGHLQADPRSAERHRATCQVPPQRRCRLS